MRPTTFDGPTRALRCAWEVTKSAEELGVQVRAGVRTGECIVGPSDITGIAVHIASGVMDLAGPGEVMVSSTVRDLVYGSDIGFADRGDHTLKGIKDARRIYSVQTLA